MDENGIPSLDDDNRDVKSHGSRGGGHSFGFSLGGLLDQNYQGANRVYSTNGLIYFTIVLIGYAVAHLIMDNLGNYSLMDILYSLILSAIMLFIYLFGYIVVDHILFNNPIDLRYSFSKFGSYGLWSLLGFAAIMIFWLITSLASHLGIGNDTLGSMFNVSNAILKLMDLWLRLVPLLIFFVQRGAEFKARLVSGLFYIVYIIILGVITLLVGLVYQPQGVNLTSNHGQPNYAVIADYKHKPVKGAFDYATNPKNVILTSNRDKSDDQLALAYAQYESESTHINKSQLKQQLLKNGFLPAVVHETLHKIKL